MKTSYRGIELIVEREGEKLNSYLDSAGVWTIGVGHTGPYIHENMNITVDQSRRYLQLDIDECEMAIDSNVSVPLSENQYDCLVSFIFNVGVNAFKNSTLLSELNNGHYDRVPSQLIRWNKITDPLTNKKIILNGLVNRRNSEVAQWVSGYGLSDQTQVAEPEAPNDSPPITIFKESKTIKTGAAITLSLIHI